MQRVASVTLLVLWATGCGLLYDFELRPDGGPGIDAELPDSGNRDAGPFDAGAPCSDDTQCDSTLANGCPLERCRNGVCGLDDADGDGTCFDDDCDDLNPLIGENGFVECDEALLGVCANGSMRVCQDGNVISDTCVGGAEQAPVELCNGLDDDCDGRTDEDVPLPDLPTDSCAAPELLCVGGEWQIVRPPAAAGPDLCDPLQEDSDCDGSIDEDCVPAVGDCVFVRTGSPGDPADPTRPSDPIGSIEAAVTWLRAVPTRPRQICLLTTREAGPCGAATFLGADVPLGVGIIGNLYVDPGSGEPRACNRRDATSIRQRATAPYALRFVDSLGDVPLQPTFVRNTLVEIPENFTNTTVGIDVAEGQARIQEVVIRPEANNRNVDSDGIHLASNARAVLSDVAVQYRSNVAGTGIVAQPNSRLTITRGPDRASILETCDFNGYAIEGGTGGWAIDADRAVVLGQRVAVCPGGAGAVHVQGAALALAESSLVGNLQRDDFVGVHLEGGASGILHEFTAGGVTGDTSTTVFRADGTDTTLRLSRLTTTTMPSVVGIVADMTLIECADDATCLLTDSEVGFSDPSSGQSVGLDCHSSALCVVHDSEITGNVAGGSTAIGVLLSDNAAAAIRYSTVTGGCGAETAVGIAVHSGGAARVERADVFGTQAGCPTSNAVGLEVDGGGIDALSSSFSSGFERPALPCPPGMRALYVTNATPGEAAFRNSVFAGGICASAQPAVELNSSATTLMGYCGLAYADEMLVDGVAVADDAAARASGIFAADNIYTDDPRFVPGPSSLSIAASSPFAASGGAGAPPTDRFGAPRNEPPARGCCEP